MAMHPTIEKHLDEIRAAAERFGLAKLEIFGSAMTPEFDEESSDVDFIVHYPEGYDYGFFGKRLFDFEEEVSGILNRPAQMVMTSALKRESFRGNANRTRTVIYVAPTSDRRAGSDSDALPVHTG